MRTLTGFENSLAQWTKPEAVKKGVYRYQGGAICVQSVLYSRRSCAARSEVIHEDRRP